MDYAFELLLALAAVAAGAIASVAGFIGSVLTPLLATQVGTKAAVAAVSIPHIMGDSPASMDGARAS